MQHCFNPNNLKKLQKNRVKANSWVGRLYYQFGPSIQKPFPCISTICCCCWTCPIWFRPLQSTLFPAKNNFDQKKNSVKKFRPKLFFWRKKNFFKAQKFWQTFFPAKNISNQNFFSANIFFPPIFFSTNVFLPNSFSELIFFSD